jgi:hypothetical protein
MPRSIVCPICGKDVAVQDELGWAIVELREVVSLSPVMEFLPHESTCTSSVRDGRGFFQTSRPDSRTQGSFRNTGPGEDALSRRDD